MAWIWSVGEACKFMEVELCRWRCSHSRWLLFRSWFYSSGICSLWQSLYASISFSKVKIAKVSPLQIGLDVSQIMQFTMPGVQSWGLVDVTVIVMEFVFCSVLKTLKDSMISLILRVKRKVFVSFRIWNHGLVRVCYVFVVGLRLWITPAFRENLQALWDFFHWHQLWILSYPSS